MCEPLAIGIVRGGEGATKLITVEVTGGATDVEAKRAARAIANSPLVKTAVHGADPNWGRLVAVAGRAGVDFNLDRARGADRRRRAVRRRTAVRRARAAGVRATCMDKDVTLRVDLGTGKSRHGADVDVRPQRRIREDQRGVPNMSVPATRPGATAAWRPSQFLSVLDLTPDELETCLDLAASMKAARARRPSAREAADRAVTSRCSSTSRRCARARRS